MNRPTRLVKPALATLALLTAVTALTGCVEVPDAGPVVEATGKGQANPIEGPYNDPQPPQSGASPQEIVQGFLDAMTARPVQTVAAQQFLTKRAQRAWKPQRKLIVYADITNPRGSSAAVSVRLGGADQIGIRGNWQGALPVADRLMSFPMRQEGDEWRIDKAPNALVVPKRSFFDTAYQRANLYFFDPTGRILVPEPTYVPSGDQLAGTLVRSLLQGPDPSLANVERSFLPPGRASVSVPVSRAGLADIELQGEPGHLSPHNRRLLLAQLAWTLRQAPMVHTFSLTFGGHQITDAGGNSVFAVDIGAQFDPSQLRASATLYALKRGELVSGPATGLTGLDGPFGTAKLGIGSFAVSLDNQQVAATAPGELLLGPVQDKGPVSHIDGPPGARFLRPSWDFDRRLWAVEDTPSGARVEWVLGGQHHRLRVPGVSGQRVRQFLVSRDGSRLVAVIRGDRVDRIEVSRIAYDAAGRPLSATRAKQASWRGPGSPRIRDIGWVSTTSFMVVHLVGRGISELRTIAVDGSTSADNVVTNTIYKQVIGLATSAVGPTQRSYAVTRDQLIDLSVDPTDPVSYAHLHHITYAG